MTAEGGNDEEKRAFHHPAFIFGLYHIRPPPVIRQVEHSYCSGERQ
jgi:hypothetical protein